MVGRGGIARRLRRLWVASTGRRGCRKIPWNYAAGGENVDVCLHLGATRTSRLDLACRAPAWAHLSRRSAVATTKNRARPTSRWLSVRLRSAGRGSAGASGTHARVAIRHDCAGSTERARFSGLLRVGAGRVVERTTDTRARVDRHPDACHAGYLAPCTTRVTLAAGGDRKAARRAGHASTGTRVVSGERGLDSVYGI